MSRIERALHRSREAHAGSAENIGVTPEGTPEAELFVGPWDIGTETAGHASPTSAVAAPVTLVAAEPASTGNGAIALRQPASTRFHENIAEKVVGAEGLEAAALEQYRRLAGKLHQAQLDRRLNSVMVVSAVPGEGKTLTSTNLALTLSRSYKRRVLLIDADLRRPSIHDAFGLAVAPGLQEAIQNPVPGLLASAFEVAPGLAVLPAGRPTNDPLGALTSDKLKAIFAEARRTFDWVVVDTAPMAALSDAPALKDLVDGALLVISAGQTHFDLVERAVKTFGRDHFLGVVLNGVEAQEIDSAYGYSGYYAR